MQREVVGKRAPYRLVFRICVVIAFSALAQAVSAASDHKAYLIDDFEGPTALQGWRFESNPESPAASGRLAIGPGHRDHGAVLEYRLPCERDIACSAYAEALWRPASPLPKRRDPVISLWIRFPSEVEVSLVIKDTSNRTLRFPIRASIEHPKAGNWQYVVVPLLDKHAEDPAQYASGSIKGRVVETGILVQARDGVTVQGSVSFDDVRLLESPEIIHVDAMAEADPPAPESLELAPRLGVGIHLLRDEHSLDSARDAGFKFVRMDMLWANVERGAVSVLWLRCAAARAGRPRNGRALDSRLRTSGSWRQHSSNARGHRCVRTLRRSCRRTLQRPQCAV